MAERFSSDLLFIVIVLLIAAILGFLIGYFLKKRVVAAERPGTPVGGDGSENLLTASADTHEIIEKPNYENAVAEEIMGKQIGLNDLKIIEGIGPKIESILRRKSIDTWKKLADAEAEAIREMLVAEGGDRYKLHDPTTWSKQAQLAHQGMWNELKDLQDELLGGRPG